MAGEKGRAFVDPHNPNAFGICDRCGFLWNLFRLCYQYEWYGNKLTNTRFRVCHKCMDKPNEGNRPIILGPDPIPVKDPRVERYTVDEQ